MIKDRNNNKWVYRKAVTEGEHFEVNGLNIWDHQWKGTGEKIHIKDPLYGQDFTFSVYEIIKNETTGEFAAGEFSNGVWGIYLKTD